VARLYGPHHILRPRIQGSGLNCLRPVPLPLSVASLTGPSSPGLVFWGRPICFTIFFFVLPPATRRLFARVRASVQNVLLCSLSLFSPPSICPNRPADCCYTPTRLRSVTTTITFLNHRHPLRSLHISIRFVCVGFDIASPSLSLPSVFPLGLFYRNVFFFVLAM
jgi:hypothetical protein